MDDIFRRGNVVDNSRSVINGSSSIFTRRRGFMFITRDWRIAIKGWSTTSRSWMECPYQRSQLLFARRRTFYCGWGRTIGVHTTSRGCQASTRPNPSVKGASCMCRIAGELESFDRLLAIIRCALFENKNSRMNNFMRHI